MKIMIRKLKNYLHQILDYNQLPASAKLERRKDRSGLPDKDPGPEQVVEKGIEWLCAAQDNSTTNDGGVSARYSLINGWGPSYPETTGYIIPTMLKYAKIKNDQSIRDRAKRMLDWLVSIQFPEGGFQGGLIDSEPVVPVTFNTGQILMGLVSGVKEFGDEYREPMNRAAKWLVETQDPDGCWRKYATPFAKPGEKSYETHVSWALFDAARIEPDKGYAKAALTNIRWALTNQKENGWFDKCCLTSPKQPLTHTLGYVLRGLLEAFRFAKDPELLTASIKTADGLLTPFQESTGFLPGRISDKWQGTVSWACLTGSAQIAHCWLMLFQITGDECYFKAALKANNYVRRTIKIEARYEIQGAVKGSFPVYGDYGKYEYLNWACKFCIDSNMLELEIKGE